MRKDLFFSILRKAVIALLLCSAVFLLLQTDQFGRARVQTVGTVTERAPGLVSVEAAAALRPRAVLVRLPDGATEASAYDGEETLQAFRRFSAVLGEALGSAGTPAEISEAEFRAGTGEGNVFIDLGGAYPLELLSSWLGGGGGGAADRSADALYLGLGEEGVSLCFRTGDGVFYRCETAAQAESLAARMGDFQAADAYFAWENELLRGAEPYTVVLEALPELYTVSASSGRDWADLEQLMGAVGINSYLAASYDDADGTTVLMEGTRTLRIAPGGTVAYRSSGQGREFAADSLSEAVSAACRLVQRSAEASSGDAEIRLGSVEAENGTYTVHFDYCVNGIPVRLPEGEAAVVEVSGGAVLRATVNLRRYTLTGETETVLRHLRAAAIAAEEGGAPVLIYLDSGDRAQCVWVNQ